MSEQKLERKSSRTSILKSRKSLNQTYANESTSDLSTVKDAKRVNFANSNFVKPFTTDSEKNTIWDNTYEEQVNTTDSLKSNDLANTKADNASCFYVSEGDKENFVSSVLSKAFLAEDRLHAERNNQSNDVFMEKTYISSNTRDDMELTCVSSSPSSNIRDDMELTCVSSSSSIEQKHLNSINNTMFSNNTEHMKLTCVLPLNNPEITHDRDMEISMQLTGDYSNLNKTKTGEEMQLTCISLNNPKITHARDMEIGMQLTGDYLNSNKTKTGEEMQLTCISLNNPEITHARDLEISMQLTGDYSNSNKTKTGEEMQLTCISLNNPEITHARDMEIGMQLTGDYSNSNKTKTGEEMQLTCISINNPKITHPRDMEISMQLTGDNSNSNKTKTGEEMQLTCISLNNPEMTHARDMEISMQLTGDYSNLNKTKTGEVMQLTCISLNNPEITHARDMEIGMQLTGDYSNSNKTKTGEEMQLTCISLNNPEITHARDLEISMQLTGDYSNSNKTKTGEEMQLTCISLNNPKITHARDMEIGMQLTGDYSNSNKTKTGEEMQLTCISLNNPEMTHARDMEIGMQLTGDYSNSNKTKTGEEMQLTCISLNNPEMTHARDMEIGMQLTGDYSNSNKTKTGEEMQLTCISLNNPEMTHARDMEISMQLTGDYSNLNKTKTGEEMQLTCISLNNPEITHARDMEISMQLTGDYSNLNKTKTGEEMQLTCISLNNPEMTHARDMEIGMQLTGDYSNSNKTKTGEEMQLTCISLNNPEMTHARDMEISMQLTGDYSNLNKTKTGEEMQLTCISLNNPEITHARDMEISMQLTGDYSNLNKTKTGEEMQLTCISLNNPEITHARDMEIGMQLTADYSNSNKTKTRDHFTCISLTQNKSHNESDMQFTCVIPEVNSKLSSKTDIVPSSSATIIFDDSVMQLTNIISTNIINQIYTSPDTTVAFKDVNTTCEDMSINILRHLENMEYTCANNDLQQNTDKAIENKDENNFKHLKNTLNVQTKYAENVSQDIDITPQSENMEYTYANNDLQQNTDETIEKKKENNFEHLQKTLNVQTKYAENVSLDNLENAIEDDSYDSVGIKNNVKATSDLRIIDETHVTSFALILRNSPCEHPGKKIYSTCGKPNFAIANPNDSIGEYLEEENKLLPLNAEDHLSQTSPNKGCIDNLIRIQADNTIGLCDITPYLEETIETSQLIREETISIPKLNESELNGTANVACVENSALNPTITATEKLYNGFLERCELPKVKVPKISENLIKELDATNGRIVRSLKEQKFRELELIELEELKELEDLSDSYVNRFSDGTPNAESNTGEESILSDFEVPKSLEERVKEAASRCDYYWEFHKSVENIFYFFTLDRIIPFKVKVHPDSESVEDIQSFVNLKDDVLPVYFYLSKVLGEKLNSENLRATLGAKFDLLTLLDFICMCVVDLVDFYEEFKLLEEEYALTHKFRMNPDLTVVIEILNTKYVIWWIVSVNISIIRLGEVDSITATHKFDVDVDNQCIEEIAKKCSGPKSLRKFIMDLNVYVEKVGKRVVTERESELLSYLL